MKRTLFDIWLFGEDRNADIILTYYYFLYITCIINFCNIPLFVSTASYILHLCWPMMRNNIEIMLKVMLSDCQLINF